MSLLSAVRLAPKQMSILFSRTLATPARPNPEDLMDYEDPIERAHGRMRQILLARLNNDDRYEPKALIRGPGTKENPNLIPCEFDNRMVMCFCTPHSTIPIYHWLRKGYPDRCRCGHWFKIVDADPLTFIA